MINAEDNDKRRECSLAVANSIIGMTPEDIEHYICLCQLDDSEFNLERITPQRLSASIFPYVYSSMPSEEISENIVNMGCEVREFPFCILPCFRRIWTCETCLWIGMSNAGNILCGGYMVGCDICRINLENPEEICDAKINRFMVVIDNTNRKKVIGDMCNYYNQFGAYLLEKTNELYG